MTPGSSTSKRGFASMDSDRQREIASKGGRIVNSLLKQAAKAVRPRVTPAATRNNAFPILTGLGAVARPLYF